MSVLITVNAGSSSLRLAAFGTDGEKVSQTASGHLLDVRDGAAGTLRAFLEEHGIKEVAAVAHRVVHGGARFSASCVIDHDTEAEIERLIPLAPLHNPPALAGIRACRALFGARIPQVAVFDTAFYADLPEAAATYALPQGLCRKHDIRRYGFHGLAHQAMWRRWRELRPDLRDGGRVISLQLGAGCSVTAVRDGRAVDTSMGFSPLEGLMMATRCGDVDAGLLLFLQRAEGLSPAELERLLNEESGLLGVSGESADMQRLLESQSPAARLAVEVYCHRARKYVGAFVAVLGGADAILFGGGVGEHAPQVRAMILDGMQCMGIELNPERNRAAVGVEARLDGSRSGTEAWVIQVDEAAILAREALAAIRAHGTNSRKEGQ
jgi:acetate kinase